MSITDKITEIIQAYHVTTIEANSLAYLMGLRKDLSVYAFELGVTTAKLKRQLEEVKAQRKIAFTRSKYENLKEGIGKSETIAENSIEALRLSEATTEGKYAGCKIILEQTNEVISSIQQDISQLKAEYKAEN